MGSIPNSTSSISPHPAAYSVAVVGGGIGGLCLAIGLLKHPHIDVQVYEAAPSFGEIGAGIAIGPNAQRALQLLSPETKAVFDGMATTNLWASHANDFAEYRSAYGPHDGEIIHTQKNQTGMQCVHRAKFLDGLVRLVPTKRCHFNKRLISIDAGVDGTGPCTMHFKDGTSAQADAVVGADGIHSHVRPYVLGDDHPAARPVFTGTGTYHGIVPMDRAVERLGAEHAQNSIMLCGPGRAILSYPIEHGELLNTVLLQFELGKTWEHETWILPKTGEDLRKEFEGWGDAALGMVDLVDGPDLALWALFDQPPAPFYNKGAVVLMGDAAHATTPFQGQGAAQAIEDALALTTILGHVHAAERLPQAFAAYNQVRLPRSQRIVTTSRESGQLVGMQAPGVGDDLGKMRAKLATRMHWIWNRDLVAQNDAVCVLSVFIAIQHGRSVTHVTSIPCANGGAGAVFPLKSLMFDSPGRHGRLVNAGPSAVFRQSLKTWDVCAHSAGDSTTNLPDGRDDATGRGPARKFPHAALPSAHGAYRGSATHRAALATAGHREPRCRLASDCHFGCFTHDGEIRGPSMHAGEHEDGGGGLGPAFLSVAILGSRPDDPIPTYDLSLRRTPRGTRVTGSLHRARSPRSPALAWFPPPVEPDGPRAVAPLCDIGDDDESRGLTAPDGGSSPPVAPTKPPHKRTFSSRLRLGSFKGSSSSSGPPTPLSPMTGGPASGGQLGHGFEQLGGSEKRRDIENILEKLEVDLVKTNILPPIRNEILERLKQHTTAVNDLDPLLTKRGVEVLCHQGFDGTSPTTGRIAMRCLANIMLFSEPCRQWFVDEGYPKEAVERMKVDNREDELLCARLLFLCTYNTDLNFDPLFEKEGIAEAVNTNLARHSKLFTKTAGKSSPPPLPVSACNETLKLLYNLTNFYPHQAPGFSKSILPILKMLKNVVIPAPPLQPPVSSLVHALIHLDLEDKKARLFLPDQNPLFPIVDPNINIERLIQLLDLALGVYADEDVDKYLAPLVQVLLRVSEFAPPGPKSLMRALLLPSDADREKVLGQGDSLPARLLRLSAAPLAPNLRQHVPALLFELSDKDARRFVRNVGYGFAAGFLVSNGVQIPGNAMEAWSTGEGDADERANPSRRGSRTTHGSSGGDAASSDAPPGGGELQDIEEVVVGATAETGPSRASGLQQLPRMVEINPITGQRRDREPPIADGPPMSEEEKMREAERMFVLFERLRATGVIDVENPVARAMREGQFEELE